MDKVTVLITTFNRANQLRNSLERMTNLTKADEYLIVDDGSSDNTKEVVDSFVDKLPVKYIYNHNPNWSICSMARNIGVKNALGDIIITTEPELIWVTDLVKQMLEKHEKYPNQIISAGVIYHAQPATIFNPGFITDPLTALKNEIVEDYQTQPRSYHPSGYCKTKNMQATFAALYKKQWLEEVGGWNEELPGAWGWDDILLCTRLRINGINQHICHEIEAIHCFHSHPPGDVWSKGSQMNEDYMKSLKLNEVEAEIIEKKRLGTYTEIDPRLIANKEKDWGVIKNRG